MAQTYTDNLHIPKIDPSRPFLHTQIDDALEAIDQAVAPIDHVGDKSHWKLWEKTTAYGLKEVFRTSTCPSWGFWEVTQAGTSGTTEPTGYGEGDTFNDGTCKLVLRRLTQGGGSTVKPHELWTDFQPSHLYAVGDVFRSTGTPSWGYWEVTQAGTSGTQEPTGTIEGTAVTSGTMKCVLKRIGSGSGKGLTDWKQGEPYKEGDTAIYNNAIYKANTDTDTTQFKASEWDEVGAGSSSSAQAKPWETGKKYYPGDMAKKEDQLYFCLTEHTSSDFETDLESGYWKLVSNDQTVIGYNGSYSQITKEGATAGYSIDIDINPDKSFCHPPVEVLKYTQGNPASITINTFSGTEADKFEYDSRFIEFDGTMHLKQNNGIQLGQATAVTVTSGGTSATAYFRESQPIDFGVWKKTISAEATGANILFYKNGSVYGQSNGTLSLLAQNWDSLGGQGKFDVFESADASIGDGAGLESLGSAKMLSCEVGSYSATSGTVKALPEEQLVMPKEMVNLNGYKGIIKANSAQLIKQNNNVVCLATFNEGETAEKPLEEFKAYTGTVQMDSDSALGGKSIRLNGSSIAYIENIDTTAIKQNFSIDFWLKLNYVPTSDTPVIWIGGGNGARGNVAEGIALVIRNGHLALFASTGSGWDIANAGLPTPLTAGEWIHCAITKAGDMAYSWKNGTLAAQSVAAPSHIVTFHDNSVALGGMVGMGRYIDGWINGLRIIGDSTIFTEPFVPPTSYDEPPIYPTDGASVMVAVADENGQLFSIDALTREWGQIPATAQSVLEDGINISALGSITEEEWSDLLSTWDSMGFAYALSVGGYGDKAEVDNMELDVTLLGSWNKATHPTDYTYGYPASDILRVNLVTGGTYKINYLA